MLQRAMKLYVRKTNKTIDSGLKITSQETSVKSCILEFQQNSAAHGNFKKRHNN